MQRLSFFWNLPPPLHPLLHHRFLSAPQVNTMPFRRRIIQKILQWGAECRYDLCNIPYHWFGKILFVNQHISHLSFEMNEGPIEVN